MFVKHNHKLMRMALTVFGAMLLALGVVGESQQAEARLNPFYVVKGVSYASVVPRILCVLDNSGRLFRHVFIRRRSTRME